MKNSDPAGDDPYRVSASALATPEQQEHWRKLRRELRATILAEQRRATVYFVLGVGLAFVAVKFLPYHLGPGWWRPDRQEIAPAYGMAALAIVCSGMSCRHVVASSLARRRVRQLEREHPESSAAFFTPP